MIQSPSGKRRTPAHVAEHALSRRRLLAGGAAATGDLVLAASPRATIRGAEETRDADLRPELEAIRIPTAIFHGVHDQVVPFELAATEQQRLIPGATLVPFDDSGHGPFLDDKDKGVADLAVFVG